MSRMFNAIDEEITSLESEYRADSKRFYNEINGPERVAGLIASLDALRARLNPLPNNRL